jgi:hypothetical protein
MQFRINSGLCLCRAEFVSLFSQCLCCLPLRFSHSNTRSAITPFFIDRRRRRRRNAQ